MIDIPKAAGYSRNADRAGDLEPCCVCGKGIKQQKTQYIRTYYGGVAVSEAEAGELRQTDPNGDTGWYAIGADCLRQHPELRPYLVGLKEVVAAAGDTAEKEK